MHHEEIITHVRAATEEVFSTMLGLEVRAGEAVVEQAAPGPTDGVVSLVGLAGPWAGTGSVSCSAAMACKLSSQFLMTEFDSVTEEVLDAIGELTNIIIGNFKSAMEDKLGPMGLSIPTVIYGRNFTTRTISNNNWTLIPFTCDGAQFEVHVCLTPNTNQRPAKRPGYSQLHDVNG